MKNLIQSIICFALFLGTFGTTTANSNPIEIDCTYEESYIIVPGGTRVSLELNQTVHSEQVEVGHILDFAVYRNVVINGKVVIRSGALAEGEVTHVNKTCNACAACDGPCSQVTVKVRSVQTVDGSFIELGGKPHMMRGQCCGTGPAIINQGTRLTARTLQNSPIRF